MHTCNNPNLDLVKNDVYTKFAHVLSIFSSSFCKCGTNLAKQWQNNYMEGSGSATINIWDLYGQPCAAGVRLYLSHMRKYRLSHEAALFIG